MDYASANDLPSVLQMRDRLAGLRALSRLTGREHRRTLMQLEAQLNRLTATVDKFYDLLGPRHWVFHDDLDFELVAEVVVEPAADPAVAEQAFIASQYSHEHLMFMIGRLHSLSAMRDRADLIDKARVDYFHERYYAVVLVLIAVMDGFVGDVDPANRKGLHARDQSEITAWDSVVGHHQGLRNTQRSFTQSFKRTTTEPVYELHRNGIVHGNLLNFDNIIVATKAWNRLFAVADWARAQKLQPLAEPKTTWSELVTGIKENARVQRRIAEWKPSTLSAGKPGFVSDDLAQVATAFLKNWHSGRWGLMGPAMPLREQTQHGKGLPKYIRDSFGFAVLSEESILELRFIAPALAECVADLDFGDLGRFRSVSRWCYEDEVGDPRVPPERGTWRLAMPGPAAFLRNAGQ